jgi:hypothetical protein
MISEFFALLSVARAVEQSAENTTIIPRRICSFLMTYKATIERIGRTDEIKIASSLTTERMRWFEKINISPP